MLLCLDLLETRQFLFINTGKIAMDSVTEQCSTVEVDIHVI